MDLLWYWIVEEIGLYRLIVAKMVSDRYYFDFNLTGSSKLKK